MDVNETKLLYWTLILVLEDCYVPQSAQLVLEVAAEQSSETHAIIWALAGMKASGEICRN